MYRDYYSILELEKNASRNEIRKAYRRLAKKYHPDIYKAKDAHDKFIEITEAYEVLINQNYKYYQKPPSTTTTDEWRNAEYRRNEEYEKFRQEAREKAKRQAQMRYEEFQKQNEVFQKSGLNDLFLVFKILTRIIAIFIFLFLLSVPVFTAIYFDWRNIFILFFTWPIAGIIAWNIYDNRKNYFLPGKFYYNAVEIKKLFKEKTVSEQNCYFCRSKLADSKPLKLEFLKLKDIRIRRDGFRQYQANYINDKIEVLIPRSRKAFVIHSFSTMIKVLAVLGCAFFLDLSSFLWRLIMGLVIGGILSKLVMIFSRTRSNVSYLYSYNLILRIVIWLMIIISMSRISIHPFNIRTTEFIYFAVTSIIIFDCLIMQVLGMMLKTYSSKPLIGQYPEVSKLFDSGYTLYNEMPVFSVIYPLFKWIFG
jgi:hypothetical protein